MKRSYASLLPVLALAFMAASLAPIACSSSNNTSAFNSSSGSGSGSGGGSGSSSGGSLGDGSPIGQLNGTDASDAGQQQQEYPDGAFCTGLQCQVENCGEADGGLNTTISGNVFDPAGKNVLYNVVVYIPNSALQPLPSGASCDSCNSLYSGDPVAVATTDATGHFVIPNAPDGTNIPIVIQDGKWRMQTTISTVTKCVDNPQPDGMLKFPSTVAAAPSAASASAPAASSEMIFRPIAMHLRDAS